MSRKQQIFKINVLKKLALQQKSCISVVPSTRLLALPPFFLNDMKSGIIYLLNSILKKYDRALDGIIIGYQNIKVLMDENTGIIPMGTAETEVNVSVEFYIFQPKIGSHLQGIVNKKSNNHIGCLVHKYFNATLLKPEHVEYEDWICKDLAINDTIVFKVKDLDFTGLLPYIEGTIDDDELNDMLKQRRGRVCNLGNNQLVSSSESKMCSEKCPVQCMEGSRVTVRQTKNEEEEEEVDVALHDTVDRLIKERLNEKNLKVMDKMLESTKEKISGADPKVAADHLNRKKKRKKEKKGKDDGSLNTLSLVEDLMKKAMGDILDSKDTGQEDHDNINKPVYEEEKKKKKKKEMKAKGNNSQSANVEKVNECLAEKEDVIFHSTLLESHLKKMGMEMTFCSPISVHQETTSGEIKSKKNKRKLADKTTDTPKKDVLGKSKKEKRNKDEKDGLNTNETSDSKKLKNLEAPSKGRISPRSSPLKNGRVSESGDEKPKSTIQGLLEEKHMEKMSRVKQECGSPDRESSSSERKAVSKKGSKKEKEKHSLYEELMKQAMSAINFKREVPKVAAEVWTEPSEQEFPVSGSVTSEGKSRREKSKGKRKRKSSEGPEDLHARKKIKNGSMYFLESSPEKMKEDKSLFSDSECSRTSPVKKRQEINGDVSGSEVAESKTQSATEEPSRKEEKRVKSEGKDKRGGKEKGRRKAGGEGQKEEDSLSKSWRDAKSLINS